MAAIIVHQVLIYAAVGYTTGWLVTRLSSTGYEGLGLDFVISPQLDLGMFAVTLLMCLAPASLSARKAFQVDPAVGFRAWDSEFS